MVALIKFIFFGLFDKSFFPVEMWELKVRKAINSVEEKSITISPITGSYRVNITANRYPCMKESRIKSLILGYLNSSEFNIFHIYMEY